MANHATIDKMKLISLTKENTIKTATAILVTTLALSNILGVIRDHFLAQKITTDLLDTYYAAFRLPDLIFNVIILGAVSSAFIPTFSTLLSQNKKDEAHRLASAVLTIGMVMVLGAIAVLYILLPWLTQYLVPDFSPENTSCCMGNGNIFLTCLNERKLFFMEFPSSTSFIK